MHHMSLIRILKLAFQYFEKLKNLKIKMYSLNMTRKTKVREKPQVLPKNKSSKQWKVKPFSSDLCNV
ncbi:hypothetical protein RhiirA4_464493 [Rhizophagus irregularis]|uniref:Uncharacterized protein n=1 Tax=Rhizophagus irregularis TaxID=588596 RepID=A0A2I1GQ81_9GLOM|nr:hypothetical protein RhiirA4_464493 [Rhizophagus irregularis]